MLVTHDQAEALSMGREVAVLRDGRLIQTAAPEVLYRSPVDLGVARFVGEAVIVPGHARAGLANCALGEIALIDPRLEGPIDVMIRPEQIQVRRGITEPPGPPADQQGAIAITIACTFYGPDTAIQLAIDGIQHSINARILGHDAPEPGERVQLAVAGPVMAYKRASTAHDERHPTSNRCLPPRRSTESRRRSVGPVTHPYPPRSPRRDPQALRSKPACAHCPAGACLRTATVLPRPSSGRSRRATVCKSGCTSVPHLRRCCP